MTVGRVISVHKDRLGTQVPTTVTGDGVVRVIGVDSSVVDFDEDGGQLVHQPTGDIYSYDSADFDTETITLSAGLPGGKEFAEKDTLLVYPRSDDFYAQVMIDDDPTDVVTARVPQAVRNQIEEGGRDVDKGDVLRLVAGDEEWQVTEQVGKEGLAGHQAGDSKWTFRSIAGGGVLIDDGWLKCDGTSVLRAQYPNLFNAIGTTFGSADSTHFNLPDMRGRSPFGTGTSVTLGETDGVSEANRGPDHDHNILSVADHNHNISSVSHNGDNNTTGGGALDRVRNIAGNHTGSHDHGGNTAVGGSHNHSGSTSIAGSAATFGYLGHHCLIKT